MANNRKTERKATQDALNKTEGATSDDAAKDIAAQAAAAKKAEEAQKREQSSEEAGLAKEDELYRKALNEKNGYTLVPASKIGKNHTVKQVGKKVYPGDMVIAERL